MHSTQPSGLQTVFVRNAECKHNFVYEKAPQGIFYIPPKMAPNMCYLTALSGFQQTANQHLVQPWHTAGAVHPLPTWIYVRVCMSLCLCLCVCGTCPTVAVQSLETSVVWLFHSEAKHLCHLTATCIWTCTKPCIQIYMWYVCVYI